ncbi:T9SS type A sorting domain-containing protein [Chishuiella changwenlii]|jgi:hypothetical protein|uniref:T9SS type A sorting domain-containing protein n=1 Tax=Chishuiella changwenlii TaxID=1434701 RepID=UPI002FD9AF2D
MKKNLLALFALGAICSSLNAQNTFINDAVIVKVNPNTLFYNGGSVTVNTPSSTGTTEKIINQGNIQIRGGFTNQNTTGKNFVNKYTSTSSYGQLIIDNAATTVTGNLAIERSTPDMNNDEYVISLPFKNSTADYVINSLTGGSFFKGECAVNVDCGATRRYEQSLFSWDVAESEYDAVPAGTNINPQRRYLLNLRNNSPLRTAINSVAAPIKFAGIPNNNNSTFTLKSGLKGSSQSFDTQTWAEWKKQTNNYAESYDSYIGNQTTTNDASRLFGKNLHRLSNPFTSNLDLSNVGSGVSWVTFNTTAGANQSPAQAGNTALRFRVFKIANNYTIKWNNSGNTTTAPATPVSAYLLKNGTNNNYFWTGNPEALLVRPYESFFIDYSAVNVAGNRSSRIVEANINITDAQKTFSYNFTTTGSAGSPPGAPYLYSRSANNNDDSKTSLLNNEELKAKGLVTDFDFTQLELFVINADENTLQGNAAYLLNANFMATGSAASTQSIADNNVFFYEETKDGEVVNNAQTITNQYNSEDYIGKPLRVGFNDLKEGNNYRLNLNLYEYSILNKVENLNLGKYYLLDKVTNKVTEVDGNTEISFTADDKINDRFEFYWNESPKTLSTDNLNKNNTTYLYTKTGGQYIKFEQNNTTADINVYDLTGRQVFTKNSVSTSADFKLDFNNIPSVYVVKITYKDGKTVTKKTIKK